MGSLRASWGCFGRALGESWHVQGRLGGVLGLSWGVLGRFWEGFGMSWEPSGSLLAVFLEDFLYFKQCLAIHENSKKPRKTNGFSLIFEVPGGFWGSEN